MTLLLREDVGEEAGLEAPAATSSVEADVVELEMKMPPVVVFVVRSDEVTSIALGVAELMTTFKRVALPIPECAVNTTLPGLTMFVRASPPSRIRP
ncbi:MAG TPA: hypothetical protein VM165_00970, partial [Planctomycetaceae bacterium]|nr:hypothetical protein [Planctomycetaceae bacterium]